MDSVAPSPLYLKVAAELKSLIDGGQLAPAQRVPSVRELMRQRGISLTTAVASLRNLEQRGLIEARPQSGYYVARREPRREEPRAPRLPRGARLVGLQAMVDRLAEASLDPQIAQLGQAIPDAGFFPQARLQRALAESLRRRPRLLGEYELRTAGLPALREEIVRHYARLGAALDAEEIVVTQGCTEAINLVLRSVLARGDTLAVESPTYYGVLRIIESLGVKVLEVPTRPRDGLDIDAFRSMLATPAGRAIRALFLVSSFSNPSGASLSQADRRNLVRLCRDAGVTLIEDDIYGDLQHAGARPLPCKHFDRDGGVVLCSSFSKSLAPGARIGFAVGGRATEAIRGAKYLASLCTAPLQQEMIASYLRTGHYPRHLARLRRRFATQVEQVSDLVTRHFPAQTRISRPAGGFVLWLELAEHVDTLELYEGARRDGIDFVPGPLFSASGRYGNCLRLNCGVPVTPAVESAIRRLGALVARAA